VLAADRPSTHLVARPGRITRDELLTQAGPDASPGPWSPYAVRLAGGDPASLPAVRAGAAGVQDEGSQLVALALARAELGGQDRRWLDVCAGPGGKAALLAAVGGPAVTLSAAELAPHRALLVRNALRGDGQVLVADGTRPAWQPGAFDRVLVDAPCTGLGALRRRPEVRWRRQENDVGRLHELQTRLLLSACDSVRPGGLVAYVTCSPHPAETRAVVAAVQRQRPVERVDAVAACELPRSDQSGPDVQLWPHRHGTDAMYLALLRRADGGG
jgi:16S rRNA (cytosine967-C5)-methyltransferase